jgi:hypothetical protein
VDCKHFVTDIYKNLMTDKEYLDQISIIEIYAEILLGILRYTSVKNISDKAKYKTELTKKLKFENETDFELLRACIDLVEDSQYAIKEVYKNGLITKSDSQGEMYLRLYGVLNAFYLQHGAIIDLIRLFNMPKQKEKKEILKTAKIIEIRNKIASHATSYNIPNSKKEMDFYKLAQSSIDKWGKSLLVVGKNSSEEIDLIECMKVFTKEIEKILEEIVAKELYTRKFKNEHFEWMEYRYKYIQNYR